MNNLKSYRLFFVVVLLGAAIGMYCIKANNSVAPKENSKIYTENTGAIITSNGEPNEKTPTLPAKDIVEPTIESQQKATSNITSEAASNSDVKPQYTPPSLQKYSAQMPKVYRKINEDTPGVNYNGPSGNDEDALAYFKKISDQGDANGKFIYANRLWAHLLDSHYRDHLIKGDMIDTEFWKIRFEEVSRLYIESASAGISRAASQLPVLIPQVGQDKIEGLSWALISDKMEEQGDRTLSLRCGKLKEECTDELLENALDRAKLYLDLYNFKAEKPNNSQEK